MNDINNRKAKHIVPLPGIQMAEKDDTYVVEDLRSKFYGPLYHSNHDLVLLTIMKGRDYGLPDYNTVRCVFVREKERERERECESERAREREK